MSRRRGTGRPTRLPRGPALVAASLLASGAPLACGSPPRDDNNDVTPPQVRPPQTEPPQISPQPPVARTAEGSAGDAGEGSADAGPGAVLDAGVDAPPPQVKPRQAPQPQITKKRSGDAVDPYAPKVRGPVPPVRPAAPQPIDPKRKLSPPPVIPNRKRPIEDPPVLPVESDRSMSTQPSLVGPFDRRRK